MKMTLKEVQERAQALETLTGLTLPGKVKYAVAYNLEKLQKEAGRVEKQRMELCKQYAEKDGDGNPVMEQSVIGNRRVESFKMTPESREEFDAEYKELLEDEVEIEIRKVKQDMIDRCEESARYNIPTIAQLMAMSFMTEE